MGSFGLLSAMDFEHNARWQGDDVMPGGWRPGVGPGGEFVLYLGMLPQHALDLRSVGLV